MGGNHIIMNPAIMLFFRCDGIIFIMLQEGHDGGQLLIKVYSLYDFIFLMQI